jgi:hypothetical protein
MAVTINVQVNPVMSGWLVELYYLYGSEWFFFYDERTDSKGKAALTASSSYYPVSLKVRIPAQTMDGIAYKAQERSKSYYNGDVDYLTFNMEEQPAGIPTTLTLSAPNSVEVGEKFNLSGILYEKYTGTAIPNQTINLSYDGKSLGTATTGIDGDYLRQVSIPTEGVHTLKAEFLGAAGYAASSRTTRMGVGVPLTKIPYIAILPIVTGLAVAHLLKR